MELFRNLRQRVETWLLIRGVIFAGQRLEAKNLGRQINVAIDKRFREKDSEALQKPLAKFLRQVADQLQEDQT